MATAVEKAVVVIVCLSQKYKESANCRTGSLSQLFRHTHTAALIYSTNDASDRQTDRQTDRMNTRRYDTRCYFNVRSKADTSQLNLPHGTDN